LDAIGPYEVLRLMPGTDLRFVAKKTGVYRSDARSLGVVVDDDFAAVPSADILVVPGGPGQLIAEGDAELLDWVRAIHRTTQFTTSVCTGSLVLGAAGVLRGLRATTHWMFQERLREFGAEPTLER